MLDKKKSKMQTPYTHDAPKAATSLPEALANINAKALDEGTLRKLVDPDIYSAFERCRANGQSMDKADADALAMSVREWARSEGCIDYSHWFSPMRVPVHGEKRETFMAVDFETGTQIVTSRPVGQ